MSKNRNYSCTFSPLSIHAILSKLMLCFLSLQISPLVIYWSAENIWHEHLSAWIFIRSKPLFPQCQMHMNVAPNSFTCPFPRDCLGCQVSQENQAKRAKGWVNRNRPLVVWSGCWLHLLREPGLGKGQTAAEWLLLFWGRQRLSVARGLQWAWKYGRVGVGLLYDN